MTIDDVKFDDAVFSIPNNAISILMQVKIFQDGEIHDLEVEYNVREICDAFNLFEKTISGEYPLYKLSDDFLKKIKGEQNDEQID